MIDIGLGTNIQEKSQNALKKRREDIYNDQYSRNIGLANDSRRAVESRVNAPTNFRVPGNSGSSIMDSAIESFGSRPISKPGFYTDIPNQSQFAQNRASAASNVSSRDDFMTRAISEFGRQNQNIMSDNDRRTQQAGRGMGLMGNELQEAGYEGQKGINIANMIRQIAQGERGAAAADAISQGDRRDAFNKLDMERAAQQAIAQIQFQAEMELAMKQQQMMNDRNSMLEQMLREYGVS